MLKHMLQDSRVQQNQLQSKMEGVLKLMYHAFVNSVSELVSERVSDTAMPAVTASAQQQWATSASVAAANQLVSVCSLKWSGVEWSSQDMLNWCMMHVV